ncbi:MAG: DUF4149 domain-containing protein [Herminiimonas sp.]|nr:DUF4149 domain-containing protein [Herminiimonas sp.]
MLISSMRLVIASLWVGSIWTVGYVVAPTLFATIADRALAGTIAGNLFRIEAWISLACGAMLLLTLVLASKTGISRRKTVAILIAAMMACSAISHFGLQPFMAQLRASAEGALTGDARSQFGMLHGISSILYLLQSLLGIALLVKIGGQSSPQTV